MGLFRRFSNRLFLEWRSRQTKPHHQTTTDFVSAMKRNIIAMPPDAFLPVNPASKPL